MPAGKAPPACVHHTSSEPNFAKEHVMTVLVNGTLFGVEEIDDGTLHGVEEIDDGTLH